MAEISLAQVSAELMLTNLRVCVVGAGKMGADHIERLTRRIVGAEVAAVVDVDVSRAKTTVEAIPSAVALSDLGQALDREDVNAVVIATPGFLHEEALSRVAERDLPVPCEEPLTPDADRERRAGRRRNPDQRAVRLPGSDPSGIRRRHR